jgi:hypothetical protein
MGGFEIFATVTASTKRPAAPTSGKTSAPVTNVASLSCTPLDPVDAELSRRLGLDTPGEVLQTFVDGGLDIREGDYLMVAGVDYPIRACEDWTWPVDGLAFRRLIVEDLKR